MRAVNVDEGLGAVRVFFVDLLWSHAARCFGDQRVATRFGIVDRPVFTRDREFQQGGAYGDGVLGLLHGPLGRGPAFFGYDEIAALGKGGGGRVENMDDRLGTYLYLQCARAQD